MYELIGYLYYDFPVDLRLNLLTRKEAWDNLLYYDHGIYLHLKEAEKADVRNEE